MGSPKCSAQGVHVTIQKIVGLVRGEGVLKLNATYAQTSILFVCLFVFVPKPNPQSAAFAVHLAQSGSLFGCGD